MIKSDEWIHIRARGGMIQPYVADSVREVEGNKVLSFGPSSYGYDIRLSPKDFRIFRHIPGEVMDPKNFNPEFLGSAPMKSNETGDFFVLPGNSYGLGVALERLEVPDNVTVLCIGKSSYARCGIIANLTPAEAGWHGYLTLEFSNSSPADGKIYANEGAVQLLFFEGEPCAVSYATRKGKYMDQKEEVTLARI